MGLTTSIPSERSKNSSQPIGGSTEPGVADAILAAANELAENVLWPVATEVDQADEIPASHFSALAEQRLFGMVASARNGGLGLSGDQVRRVLRALGSGCGATSFAFAQHHGTTAAVAATANHALRDRWLPRLVDDTLAGIAYAHVRRKGPPVLTATPDGTSNSGEADGWILNGTAPWVTSWGTAEVMAVAAATPDGDLVWVLVPAAETVGLSVAGSFDLMVYGATQTVALAFDGFRAGPDMVLSVVDYGEWAEKDRFLAARPNPLCLGVGDRAMSQLRGIAPGLATDLEPFWAGVGERAEAASCTVDDGTADVAAVAAARAETLMAVQRMTTALLAAAGGGAMERSHPAQRLSREALFYVIQAQSADGRKAIFDNLTAGP